MTIIRADQLTQSTKPNNIYSAILGVLSISTIFIAISLTSTFLNLTTADPLLTESTPGSLAAWMTDQSAEDAPANILGQYAKNWATQIGKESLPPDMLLSTMRNILSIESGLIVLFTSIGLAGLLMRASWTRMALLFSLLGLDSMLFIIPTLEGDSTTIIVMIGIACLLSVLMFAPGKVSRALGFFVVLSVLIVGWEALKAFAESVDYTISVPQSAWNYDTYPSMDEALIALEAGEISVVIADRKDLDDVMPPFPSDEEAVDNGAFTYRSLRFLDDLNRSDAVLLFPVRPEFPGRLSIAVREEDTLEGAAVPQFTGGQVATIDGSFADERYLSAPRNLVLLDLKILNDLNLPHLQSISKAFMQPARRNGPVLLLRILAQAGIHTWGEAIFGFLFGAALGLLLGTVFAHSRLMERGLLPYVVASQTIPILAIAPMVVIWLGAGPLSVSVIAAYLTFFPVTINTLRGLQSPDPMAVELLRSYAASRWTILWKLRFPAALPYIFTALKVSATASVVGAIIGELPSSIRDGLGRAILDFSSDYSLISTPKLWAAIVAAATVGITFFVIVSLLERYLLRGYVRSA